MMTSKEDKKMAIKDFLNEKMMEKAEEVGRSDTINTLLWDENNKDKIKQFY